MPRSYQIVASKPLLILTYLVAFDPLRIEGNTTSQFADWKSTFHWLGAADPIRGGDSFSRFPRVSRHRSRAPRLRLFPLV